MCRTLVLAALVSGALIASHPATALDPQRALADFSLERWDSRSGLPHNMILALAQTPDGYVWAGTWEGLVRYNGTGFQTFNAQNMPTMGSNAVRALAVGRDGSLWIGTARSGLVRLQQGRWQRWGSDTGFPIDQVIALFEDSRGALWVVGEEVGVARMDEHGVHLFDRAAGIGHETIYSIAQGPDGDVYVGHGSGVDRIRGDEVSHFGAEHGLPTLAVRSVHFDRRGTLLVSAAWQVWRLQDGRFQPDPRLAAEQGDVTVIGTDSEDSLWLGTVDTGVWRVGPRGAEVLDMSLGLPQNRVQSWMQDREGSIWVGTGAGLARLKALPFTSIDARRGLSDNYVRALFPANDGGMWIATGGGLNLFREGRMQRWGRAEGLPNESLLSLARDTRDRLWIGTYGAGVAWMRDGRIEPVPGTGDISARQVRSLLGRRDGSVWIGTNSELLRWQDGKAQRFTTEDGLPRNYVMALAEDADGILWIGTSDGIARYDGQRFERVELPADSGVHDIFGIEVGSDGNLWLGTNRGLVRLRNGVAEPIPAAQGLPGSAIFQVLDDGAGQLWMCGNRGVFRVARAQANRAADDPGFVAEVSMFDRLDGMGDSQCNGGSQPAAVRAADGTLWFATALGASVIDPSKRIELPALPIPMVIESLQIDGEPYPIFEPLEVESGPRKIEIGYAGLNLRIPERVRYRHRLLGYDEVWAQVERSRLATFTNLAPGDYTFEVSATDGGSWSEPPLRMQFRVLPRWWETFWFRGAATMLIVLAIWMLYRWRLRQARESEKRLGLMVQARTRDLAEQTERLAASDREKSELLQALRRQAEALAQLASEDALTGLPNRRTFDAQLALAFERARRIGSPLAVVLADIDHFKRINDSMSHAVGDEVLRQLAAVLRRHASAQVLVARYGGEEFALMFTGSARHDVVERCERIRAEVEALDLQQVAPGLTVSLSLGIASDNGRCLHHEELLSAADEAMYEAKRGGRNRVCGS